MSVEQDFLRQFLDAELGHSLGAYPVANEALTDLGRSLRSSDNGGSAPELGWLDGLSKLMAAYNRKLHQEVHAASAERRHPAPLFFPWSNGGLFDPRGSGNAAAVAPSEDWVAGYYHAAVDALAGEGDVMLARWLLMSRDGSAPVDGGPLAPAERPRPGKLERYRRRLSVAEQIEPRIVPDDPAGRIVKADLSSDPALIGYVVSALVEGHLLTHGVEWAQAGDLGHQLERDRANVRDQLDRAEALLTFVYSISRTCPWLFAAREEERQWVQANAPMCWHQMVPTVSLWLATQVPLLALHRRAYCHALRGEAEEAYKDYYKLQQQIRHTERRLRAAPSVVVGATDFLAALDAMADHHIGELYRAKQAHTTALTHLTRADARLERLRTAGTDSRALPDEALTSARWRIELLLSNGKAHYEMGRHKQSLAWYLRAWKWVLEIQAGDAGTEVNSEPIDEAVSWLAAVDHEPVIYKDDLNRFIRPIAAQLDGIMINRRLEALAADVLTRLGHLLYVLRIEPEDSWEPDANGRIEVPTLKFLKKALQCDSASTMLRTDILKLAYRLLENGQRSWEELEESVIDMDEIGIQHQWQGGEDDFARVSRATEYVLLRELLATTEAVKEPIGRRGTIIDVHEAQTQEIARRLLAGVFIHTDSINVRRAQVHERLTGDHKPFAGASPADGPAIELVSMRRFSSAFALLPRPAAFRSLSGGYFVRIRSTPRAAPLGIVIDPGTDFVETLYRTGFSVADVQMIIVTHDHVDHMAALEPLLSLLYERRQIKGKEADPALRDGELPLLGNRGVLARLRETAQYKQLKLYEFAPQGPARNAERCDSATVEGGDSPAEKLPESIDALNAWLKRQLGDMEVRITPVSSEVMREGGHQDNSLQASFGFALQVGGLDGPSIGFTSDMPRSEADCGPLLEPLTSCDVLIAHLSSLPVSELRTAAGLGTRGHLKTSEAEDRTWLLNVFKSAETEPDHYEPDLASRLSYAYWLGNGAAAIDLVGGARLESGSKMPAHLYLRGLIDVARAHREAGREGRLFLVGELSEELGSLRGKVAHWVTKSLRNGGSWTALTADIGLDLIVGPRAADGSARVKLRCDTCDLDNDLAYDERYHHPREMSEVCIKGENEGIFYNCSDHDPGAQQSPMFLERLERYDMFGR
ncbi:MBL fold metallo-hydrolase [Conexibacter woesei]|uniref:MBL fold metallo-hydrolase n=1 Tax=Conexibacter woesei TaxID=191495 RepID=UPI0004221987|nr:MBL fold metallo-hydrolase [Conexibacter woesei]